MSPDYFKQARRRGCIIRSFGKTSFGPSCLLSAPARSLAHSIAFGRETEDEIPVAINSPSPSFPFWSKQVSGGQFKQTDRGLTLTHATDADGGRQIIKVAARRQV